MGCFYDNSNPEELKLNAVGSKNTMCSWHNDCVCRARGPEVALKRAIEPFLATPDFYTFTLLAHFFLRALRARRQRKVAFQLKSEN